MLLASHRIALMQERAALLLEVLALLVGSHDHVRLAFLALHLEHEVGAGCVDS